MAEPPIPTGHPTQPPDEAGTRDSTTALRSSPPPGIDVGSIIATWDTLEPDRSPGAVADGSLITFAPYVTPRPTDAPQSGRRSRLRRRASRSEDHRTPDPQRPSDPSTASYVSSGGDDDDFGELPLTARPIAAAHRPPNDAASDDSRERAAGVEAEAARRSALGDEGYRLDTRVAWGTKDAPLPLEREQWFDGAVEGAFADARVDREYTRYLYRRGAGPAAVMLAFVAVAFPVFISRLESVPAPALLTAYVNGALVAVTALVEAALAVALRRATDQAATAAEAAQDDNDQDNSAVSAAAAAAMGSLPPPMTAAKRREGAVADVELFFALRHRTVAAVGLTLFALGAALTTVLARSECVTPPMAPAHPHRECTDSFREAFSFPFAALCLFVFELRVLLPAAAVLVAAVLATELAYSDAYEGREVAVRVAASAAFYAALLFLAAVRGSNARQEFEDLVAAFVAHQRSSLKSSEIAAVMAAMLPIPVALRAARATTTTASAAAAAASPSGSDEAPTHIGAADPADVAAASTSSMPPPVSLAGALGVERSVLADESFSAMICMTEPVNFAAFLHDFLVEGSIVGLSHLFTLFDAGSRVFGVDSAGFVGDTYIVSAKLVKNSSAQPIDVVRFADWQHGLAEATTLPLRTAIATGGAEAGIVGTAQQRYQVQGPATALAQLLLLAIDAAAIVLCPQSRVTVRDQVQCVPWRAPCADGRRDAWRLTAVVPLSSGSTFTTATPNAFHSRLPSQHTGSGSGANASRSPIARLEEVSLNMQHGQLARVELRQQSMEMPSNDIDALDQEFPPSNPLTPPPQTPPSDAPKSAALGSAKKKGAAAASSPVVVLESPLQILAREGDERYKPARLSDGVFEDAAVEAEFARDVDERMARVGWAALLSVGAAAVVLGALHIGSVAPRGAAWAHGGLAGLLVVAVAAAGLAAGARHGLVRPVVAGPALCALTVALWLSVTFLPTSGMRNDPSFIAFGLVPVPVATVLVKLRRVALVGVCVGLVTAVPVVASGRVDPTSIAIAALTVGLVAVAVYALSVGARRQFGSRHAAHAAATAVRETNARLVATANRLMPEAVVRRGVDGAMFFELQVLAAPAPAEGASAQRQIEAKLSRLARVCRADHGRGGAMIDGLPWAVVVHVTLVPHAGTPAAAAGTRRSNSHDHPEVSASHRAAAGADRALFLPTPLEASAVPSLDDVAAVHDALEASCAAVGAPGVLRVVEALNHDVVAAGPFEASDENIALAARAALAFVEGAAHLPSLRGRFAVAAGLAVEEAQGVLLGRGAMRYAVRGPARRAARHLAEFAALHAAAAAPREPPASDDRRRRGCERFTACATRHFIDVVGADSSLLHGFTPVARSSASLALGVHRAHMWAGPSPLSTAAPMK